METVVASSLLAHTTKNYKLEMRPSTVTDRREYVTYHVVNKDTNLSEAEVANIITAVQMLYVYQSSLDSTVESVNDGSLAARMQRAVSEDLAMTGDMPGGSRLQ